MSITTPEHVISRYTGDDYALPPQEKLQVLIEDAEDILLEEIEGLEDRAAENEQIRRRINRVVSSAVIRYSNTAAEGISSHQMSVGGASEMVSYSSNRNRNSIYFTDDELSSLREKKTKRRASFMDMYGDGRGYNRIIRYNDKVGIYTHTENLSEIDGYYS